MASPAYRAHLAVVCTKRAPMKLRERKEKGGNVCASSPISSEALKHYRMTKKTLTLVARVSTENPQAIKLALEGLLCKDSITPTAEGFLVKATMHGETARELNRTLLFALRRVERKTRLRAEWTCGGTTQRFFDYLPKGSKKCEAHRLT